MIMVVCEIFKSSARIFCSKPVHLFDAVLVSTNLKLFRTLKIVQKEARTFVTVSALIVFLVYVKLDCEIWNKFKVRRWFRPARCRKGMQFRRICLFSLDSTQEIYSEW